MKILDIIRKQLPSDKLHGLGAAGMLFAIGLLGYYEYVGDKHSAETVLIALLGLLFPAPFRSTNDADVATEDTRS